MKGVSLILRLIAAGVLFQTLFFKFTGAPESVWIFSRLGVEPWGRWFAGFSELVASIMLLVPRTRVLGAAIAVGIMSGAILSHVFVLGIAVEGDGGLLFGLAWLVLIASLAILWLHREEALSSLEWVRSRLGVKL